MRIFKKKKTSGSFFEEESLDTHFDNIMKWVRDLARKDYNKLKKAMDKDYDAYQILHGIEPVDHANAGTPDDTGDFMIPEKEA